MDTATASRQAAVIRRDFGWRRACADGQGGTPPSPKCARYSAHSANRRRALASSPQGVYEI